MISYRDMTFCSRSKDCANTHCFRMIDQEVLDGAKQLGLGIAQGDCSNICEDGFTPIYVHCPGCGWQETTLAVELANADFECGGCGMHRWSDFK